MNQAYRGRGQKGPGRLVIRADEPTLTPYAGLAVTGELARRLGLAGLIDAELAVEHRARPVKQRRRGLTAGELLVALAESQLAGGDCFDDLEDVRADAAGAGFRAVAATPAAPTARQRARRFRRVHLQRVERALAQAGQRLDQALGRQASAPVTIDLDATESPVYGYGKRGARRSRTGQLAYAPYVAVWAERGRALACELEPGNKAKLAAAESARLARRALKLLPADHGQVTFRVDSAFYAVEFLAALRRQGARFTVSCSRTTAMWQALAAIPQDAWTPAVDMDHAEVAETDYSPDGWPHQPLRLLVRRVRYTAAQLSRDPRARRRRTIPPAQLQLALDGKVEVVYGYSFILTDLDGDARQVEWFHRQRAQVEERIKELKLGQALRHLPCGDHNANRVWLSAALAAMNLAAMCCDLCPAARASGKAPATAPLRRAAKTLRRLLICVPARIVRTGRRTILRLPAGFAHAGIFAATYQAVWALPPG